LNKSKIIIKNFVLLFTSNIIGQLFYLGGLVHLARILGPGGFGLWNFAQAWLMYLFRGGEMGLEVVGVREIARNPDNTPNLISAVITSRCLLAIILFFIVSLAIVFGLIPKDTIPLMIAFSIAIVPMAFILEWVFEGHQSLSSVSIARIAKGIIFFILVISFVKSTNEITLSAFFYVISITIPIVYIGWLVLKRFGHADIKDILSFFPFLWKSALPIGLATLLSNYSLFLGTMVIGYTMQRDQLGYFTASHRIMLFLWAYIISNLQRVVLPTLTNLNKSSVDSFRSFVEKFLRYAVFISFGIGLLITSFSSIIIHVLYSDNYNPSVPVLQILVWAFAMASNRMILEMALLASDRQRLYFYGMIFIAILYTTFTPLLISIYGINGAAYAALISESLYLFGLTFLWSYENSSDIWKYLIKSSVAIFIAIIIMLTIQLNVMLSLVGASIYLVFLILLKIFPLRELLEMYHLIKSVLLKSSI
jgi:O-antigen/teichoic acid export membrane protein